MFVTKYRNDSVRPNQISTLAQCLRDTPKTNADIETVMAIETENVVGGTGMTTDDLVE